MLQMETDKNFTVLEMKYAYKLVKAVKDAALGYNDYTLSRTKEAQVEAMFVGKAKFDAMLAAVSPLKSLPVKYKTLGFDIPSASLRSEELYHLVLGKRTLKDLVDTHRLQDTGFEHKIEVKGAQEDIQVQTLIAAGGLVTSMYPILSADSVSARKAGGALTVSSVDLSLGKVSLLDSALPVADGVQVELVYQTKEHLVIELKDQNKKVLAVLISKELNDYLLAND